jgi:hypothetical protein
MPILITSPVVMDHALGSRGVYGGPGYVLAESSLHGRAYAMIRGVNKTAAFSWIDRYLNASSLKLSPFLAFI